MLKKIALLVVASLAAVSAAPVRAAEPATIHLKNVKRHRLHGGNQFVGSFAVSRRADDANASRGRYEAPPARRRYSPSGNSVRDVWGHWGDYYGPMVDAQ
jgi:hypothetical protein